MEIRFLVVYRNVIIIPGAGLSLTPRPLLLRPPRRRRPLHHPPWGEQRAAVKPDVVVEEAGASTAHLAGFTPVADMVQIVRSPPHQYDTIANSFLPRTHS